MRKDRLYKKAYEKWGLDTQVGKTLEELSELIIALVRQHPQKVYEEMADVEIMLEQLKYIFGCRDMVNIFKQVKLKRLEKMLEEK